MWSERPGRFLSLASRLAEGNSGKAVKGKTEAVCNLGPFRGERELCSRLRLVILLLGLVERRYLLLEDLRLRVLLSAVAVQVHERKEAIGLAVWGLQFGKAGKPSKPPPVSRAGISVVPSGQFLREKGSDELWKHRSVFQPRLNVAGFNASNPSVQPKKWKTESRYLCGSARIIPPSAPNPDSHHSPKRTTEILCICGEGKDGREERLRTY